MLEINSLTKKYENKVAVDNLSLTVNTGEIFGFIGHNGAGKTTTIRCVCGVHTFNEGEITVNGFSIKDEPLKAKQSFAFLPDNPDLYEYLTGIKYLNFICDVCDVDKKTRKERIEKYADLFKIADNLSSPISSYSHGMKQKLALISAFVREPKLLILDEPFVGLDPEAAHILKQLLRELCDNGGAVFFSTHVLEVAEKLCDKIAIIKEGKLICQGKTQDIVKNSTLEQVFLDLATKEG